ncbi:MAG: peptidoglycan-binding protein, partial [Acidobacteria bacterium]|nr:peptidoglycan-binding protein [Acidobacteriota bacterium]
MALQSPRFRKNSRLIEASKGKTLRKGASGRHVHLIQMALIDLGYPMPKSVGGIRYSPDGSYGEETKQKVIEFQTD